MAGEGGGQAVGLSAIAGQTHAIKLLRLLPPKVQIPLQKLILVKNLFSRDTSAVYNRKSLFSFSKMLKGGFTSTKTILPTAMSLRTLESLHLHDSTYMHKYSSFALISKR